MAVLDDAARKIPIFIDLERGYVWDAGDALQLRLEHLIIGGMVGSIPDFKQQNEFLGPPLELSTEEVTLLLEKGVAQAFATANPARLSHSRGAHFVGAQCTPHNSDRHVRKDGLSHAAAIGGCSGVAGPADDGREHAYDTDDDASLADEWVPIRATAPLWLQRLNAGEDIEVAEARDVAQCHRVHWSKPQSREGQQVYAVFRDLHNRGFAMTNGLKFGGHFLVYPGDPFLYHSHFSVRVVLNDEAVWPEVLTAACRAATGAKKKLLLAYATQEGDGTWNVQYITAASVLLEQE